MNTKANNRVCPVEKAGSLDNKIRKLIQNPNKILAPYIRNNMTVLDFGCGPGFFTIEIAKMLGQSGKVIATDIQDGMLAKIRQKIKGASLEQNIELLKCSDRIDITERIDFIIAFYVIHEVPNQDNLFEELKSILKTNGKILIVEPKFHVSKKSFETMTKRLENINFEIIDKPKIFFSRSVLLKNTQ